MSKCLGRDISVRQHSKSATSRHHCDMTERLLKATLSPNQTKQTKKKQHKEPDQNNRTSHPEAFVSKSMSVHVFKFILVDIP